MMESILFPSKLDRLEQAENNVNYNILKFPQLAESLWLLPEKTEQLLLLPDNLIMSDY
jgi:hypothetical protein